MLVLARRPGQAVQIGDEVTVTVLSVQGHGERAVVRLGIEAPPGLPVARREVYLAVLAENRLASETPPDTHEEKKD
jgi:carbon storage regulator